MYIKPDDLVKQVARIAYPDYTGRTYRVFVQSTPLEVSSTWDGGSRNYWAFVNVSTMKVLSVGDTGYSSSDKVTLLPGIVAVKHIIFCGKDLGLEFYIHPDNAPAMLADGNMPDLNDLQKAWLGCLCGLTSAGRKDTISRYHLPLWLVDVLNNELADKGLVKIASNGAVSATMQGKNARETFDQYGSMSQHFLYQWGDSWRMSDTDYKYRPMADSLARQWLDVYRDKRPNKA
jgi:hypothetical protein